jgi:dihydrodipicolinate synthase/N-acetylneuraminate lyase
LVGDRRFEEARRLQRQLAPLSRLVGAMHGVPGLKAALNLIGCDVGIPRLPLLPAAAVVVSALKEALEALDALEAPRGVSAVSRIETGSAPPNRSG